MYAIIKLKIVIIHNIYDIYSFHSIKIASLQQIVNLQKEK